MLHNSQTNCFNTSPKVHPIATSHPALRSKIFNMSDASPTPKEPYGRRLMTSIIDDRARSNPQKTFMSILAGDSVTDGQRDISYADFTRAIHRCVW